MRAIIGARRAAGIVRWPSATIALVSALPDRAVAAGELAHDLTPWGMYLAADATVKGVLILLFAASIATWTIWLAKTIELVRAKRRLRAAVRTLDAAHSLAEAEAAFAPVRGPVGDFVRAAVSEAQLSGAACGDIGGRVASRLERLMAAHGRAASRGTGVLATIGATAPFIGLFGTVWGIMNSFIGIARAHTTNLAVVAPGIAEALLATAFGLVAAIPAVIIYNIFARQIGSYRALLGDAAADVVRLVGREFDARRNAAAATPLPGLRERSN